MKKKSTALFAGILLAATSPLLAACSTDGNAQGDGGSSSAAESSAGSADASQQLTIVDGWAKSVDAGGMTGVFGTLTNSGAQDLTISGVESDAAGLVELHEVTAEGVMQEIDGDVVIPANGTYELAPGANHIMLMEIEHDLLAGDEVTFTLQLTAADGSEESAEYVVLVKDYSGANEEYGSAHGEHENESH